MKINYITHNEPIWKHDDIVVHDNPSRLIEMFKNTDLIGGDTENNDLNPIYATALLSQFSDSKESYVVDKSTIDCTWLKDFTDKPLLTHNGQYDYMIWKQQYGFEFPNINDVMIIEQALGRGSGRLNNLYDVHYRRLGRYMPIPKSTRSAFTKMKHNPIFEVDHILYSGYDPHCLFEIYEIQKPLIKEYKLERRIYDIAFPLISLLGDICLEGFYLDKDKWQKILIENKTAKYHAECRLDEEVKKFSKEHIELRGGKWTRKRYKADGEQSGLFSDSVLVENENNANISYGSLTQMTTLFNILREPIPQKKDKKTQEYKNSFAEEALEQYKIEYPSTRMMRFINDLLEYKEYEKEINSFGEVFLKDRIRDGKGKKYKRGYSNSITGNVHTIYKQEFTANGRLSSGDSKRKKGTQGLGLYNSQQIPKKNKFRNCFTLTPQEIADGYLITTIDLHAAELYIFASQSGDKKLFELLSAGDIHSSLATAGYTKIIRYILENMNESRAYDEIYNLLKVNRLQKVLRKKIGIDERSEDIYVDYSQQEQDEITEVRTLKAIKERGIVIHKKDHVDIRDPFKNVVYGILYGASDPKIATTLNIATHYAKLILDGMKDTLPVGFAYLEQVARFGVKYGFIIFNDRTNSRHWFKSWLDAKQKGMELMSKDRAAIERFCKNSVVSGTQADMFKEFMVECNKYIKSIGLKDFKWKLQVHDECVFKWRSELDIPNILGKIIMDTCNLYLKNDVKMKIASYTGVYWNK